MPYRLVVNIAIHALVFAASYFYSLLLFNGLVIDQNVLEMYVVTLWPLMVIRIAVFHYYGLFSGMWRFVSFEDLIIIIRAVIISSFLCMGSAWYGIGSSWANRSICWT